jgi:hypothetical protein
LAKWNAKDFKAAPKETPVAGFRPASGRPRWAFSCLALPGAFLPSTTGLALPDHSDFLVEAANPI